MDDIELTILSIVAEMPRYGHEIQQVIDQRGLQNWLPVGFSSVYYVLNNLEKAQFIRSEFPFENLRSARKRYEVTPAGQGALKTQLMDMLVRAKGGIGKFDLALLLAHALPPGQVQQALYERRIQIARQIKTNRDALATYEVTAHGFDAQPHLYQRRITLLEADLDWLTALEDEWEQYHQPPSTASAAPDDDTPPSPKRLQKFRRPPSDD